MSIADKQILFGGAGREGSGNPWGVMGEIAGRATRLTAFARSSH